MTRATPEEDCVRALRITGDWLATLGVTQEGYYETLAAACALIACERCLRVSPSMIKDAMRHQVRQTWHETCEAARAADATAVLNTLGRLDDLLQTAEGTADDIT